MSQPKERDPLELFGWLFGTTFSEILEQPEFNFEPELVLVQVLPITQVQPAPENNEVYNNISRNDPEVIQLAFSIRDRGIQEPLLVSRDGYIISGHRRHFAASLAGLQEVPIRVHPISRTENRDDFLKLLVEMNSQRIKSTAEIVRESAIKIDPKKAHERIVNERKKRDKTRGVSLSEIDPEDDGQRCEISEAKQPFLAAILRVLEEQRDYWPLSDRQIHYRLLGPDAPLTHASKPDSQYVNDLGSYRKLTDLLTRARINYLIPWKAIDDETRTIDINAAFWSTAEFFRHEFDNFLNGYWRNRQQSQPHHIEIVGEKLTVRTILQQVAEEYTIPLTISRGMASLPPKKKIVDRFRQSKKDKLILLVASDLDPAGDAIAEDLVKCFRRDFGLWNLEAYKVALTIDQVTHFSLQPSMEARETSPTYQTFVDKYGITDAYELEAMEPSDLVQVLSKAIENVMDLKLYNQELAAEERDSAQIIAVRQAADAFFKSLNLEDNEHEKGI